MDTVVILLTLLTLLPSATPIQLSPDCEVKNVLEMQPIPTRRHITFWNSRENNELLDWIITDTFSNENLGLYINGNILRYSYHNLVTGAIKTRTTVIDPPLPVGWVDVVVEVSTQLRVTIPGRSTVMEEDMDEDVSYFTSEKITGSNVTVNCLKDPRWWEVSGGTEQVLPLGGAGTHQVTVYTMTSSMPRVSVGGNHFSLMERTNMGLHYSLPTHTTHHFSVSCQDNSDKLICKMELPQRTYDLTCPRDSCYLTVWGEPQDHFLVYLNRYPTLMPFRDGVTVLGVIGGLLITIKIYRKVKLNITTCWRSVMNYR